MGDELFYDQQIDPLDDNLLMLSVITNAPDRVTEWIAEISGYLSLPTVEPKIVYLALLTYGIYMQPCIQILVHNHCLFFHLSDDPSHMPDSIRQFLENGLYTFVGANIDMDAFRLDEYCEIGGDDTQRLDLSLLDLVFMSRPPQFFLTDMWFERLSLNEVRFYAFEGFATYLITLVSYRVAVGVYTALLVVLAAIINVCEQLASSD